MNSTEEIILKYYQNQLENWTLALKWGIMTAITFFVIITPIFIWYVLHE